MRRTARVILAVLAFVIVGSLSPVNSCPYTCSYTYDTAECIESLSDTGTFGDDCSAYCTLTGWWFYCYCSGGRCEWV